MQIKEEYITEILRCYVEMQSSTNNRWVLCIFDSEVINFSFYHPYLFHFHIRQNVDKASSHGWIFIKLDDYSWITIYCFICTYCQQSVSSSTVVWLYSETCLKQPHLMSGEGGLSRWIQFAWIPMLETNFHWWENGSAWTASYNLNFPHRIDSIKSSSKIHVYLEDVIYLTVVSCVRVSSNIKFVWESDIF